MFLVMFLAALSGSEVLAGLCGIVCGITILICSILVSVFMGMAVHSYHGSVALYIVLLLIFGIFALIGYNIAVTSRLKAYGIRIGFLGISAEDLEKLKNS